MYQPRYLAIETQVLGYWNNFNNLVWDMKIVSKTIKFPWREYLQSFSSKHSGLSGVNLLQSGVNLFYAIRTTFIEAVWSMIGNDAR